MLAAVLRGRRVRHVRRPRPAGRRAGGRDPARRSAAPRIVLGWLFLPLVFFGVDESLDPARFALLPLRRRTPDRRPVRRRRWPGCRRWPPWSRRSAWSTPRRGSAGRRPRCAELVGVAARTAAVRGGQPRGDQRVRHRAAVPAGPRPGDRAAGRGWPPCSARCRLAALAGAQNADWDRVAAGRRGGRLDAARRAVLARSGRRGRPGVGRTAEARDRPGSRSSACSGGGRRRWSGRCSARPARATRAAVRTAPERSPVDRLVFRWLPRNRFGALVVPRDALLVAGDAAPGQPDHLGVVGVFLPVMLTVTGGGGRAATAGASSARWPRSVWRTSSASRAARTRRTSRPACPGGSSCSPGRRPIAMYVVPLLVVDRGGGRRRRRPTGRDRRQFGTLARRVRRSVSPWCCRSRSAAPTRCRTPPTRSRMSSGGGMAKGLLTFGALFAAAIVATLPLQVAAYLAGRRLAVDRAAGRHRLRRRRLSRRFPAGRRPAGPADARVAGRGHAESLGRHRRGAGRPADKDGAPLDGPPAGSRTKPSSQTSRRTCVAVHPGHLDVSARLPGTGRVAASTRRICRRHCSEPMPSSTARMFHVNPVEPGAQIHSSDPFATPEQDKSAVRRLRGRLAAPVTLWTTPGPAGLTVSSMLVADGDPGPACSGLIDEESDFWDAVSADRRLRGHPAGDQDQQLADRFAGLMPAPGGLFATGEWTETEYGPVPRDAGHLGRVPAGRRAADAAGHCWSRPTIETAHAGPGGRPAAAPPRPVPARSASAPVRRSQRPAQRSRRPSASDDAHWFVRCRKARRHAGPYACPMKVVNPLTTDVPDSTTTEKYLAVQSSEEFARLRKTLRGFIFPMTVAFFLWYAALRPALRVRPRLHEHQGRRQHQRRAHSRPAAVRHDVPDRLVLLALRGRKVDPLADEIRAELEAGGRSRWRHTPSSRRKRRPRPPAR